jgi:hypothetical protein
MLAECCLVLKFFSFDCIRMSQDAKTAVPPKLRTQTDQDGETTEPLKPRKQKDRARVAPEPKEEPKAPLKKGSKLKAIATLASWICSGWDNPVVVAVA